MYESISLFSGAMGLDLGLEKAGINITLCQDFDASCYETMLMNGKPAMTGDIRNIESSTILERDANRRGISSSCWLKEFTANVSFPGSQMSS